jgi:GR25 family glycosyltransferase involved in LPS biosynthesis
MPAGWQGYFINLDRSPDRRQAMEAGLAAIGLSGAYRRFPAVGGEALSERSPLSAGQCGCFRSHHGAVAQAIESNSGGFVHIIEDDVIFARAFPAMLGNAIASGALAQFDLVFTETMVMLNIPELQRYLALYASNVGPEGVRSLTMIDLADGFAGTNSYLINPRSLLKVAEAMARGLAAGPARPVDLFLSDEVVAGRLKAAVLFPFLTGTNLDLPSTLTPATASVMMTRLLRNSFFVGHDGEANRQRIRAIAESQGVRAGDDAQRELVVDILRIGISDKYQPV